MTKNGIVSCERAGREEAEAYAAGQAAVRGRGPLVPPGHAEAIAWHWHRGLFERAGKIAPIRRGAVDPRRIEVRVRSATLARAVAEAWGGEATSARSDSYRVVRARSLAAVAVLDRLYARAAHFRADFYQRYVEYLNWPQRLGALSLRFARLDPAAVPPRKAHPADTGYDLTVIGVHERRPGGLVVYETGIAVAPPEGWYCDVVARSSLPLRGHCIANSVGIIDRMYRGPIRIPMLKFDAAAPDLAPGTRVAQLILRPLVHAIPVEVPSLDETPRGQGGFGHTGS